MPDDLRILMVGLADSGKTTFLAALYESVRADDRPVEALELVEEPEHREYFHQIAQTWLRLERMSHSNTDEPRHAKLEMQTPGQSRFGLEIPDISGEDFNHAWEGEPWPAAVTEIARQADAVMIFARRDRLVPPLALPPDGFVPPPEKAGTEWSAADSPTQTKLADLLETLDSLVSESLPTAILASAWDAADEEEEIRPDQWLKLRMPLLWQMLECRAQERPYAVYGISAQGGDVEDADEKARLAKVRPPHARVRVWDGEQVSSDISAPVRWLFEWLQ